MNILLPDMIYSISEGPQECEHEYVRCDKGVRIMTYDYHTQYRR